MTTILHNTPVSPLRRSEAVAFLQIIDSHARPAYGKVLLR